MLQHFYFVFVSIFFMYNSLVYGKRIWKRKRVVGYQFIASLTWRPKITEFFIILKSTLFLNSQQGTKGYFRSEKYTFFGHQYP